MKKQQTALSLIISIFVFLFLVQPVSAVEYGGIGGRPAYPDENNERTSSIFIYETAPGATEEDGIVVVNNTSEAKTILVYATDTTPSSGGGFACKQYAEEVIDIGTWFTLEKNEITLEPNTNEIIPFTVTIPEGVSVGEHDACIVIQEKVDSADGAGINISVRAAIRAMVLIPGNVVKRLSIESFTYVESDNDKSSLNLTLLNSGNVSVDADIEVLTTNYLTNKLFARSQGEYTVLHSNLQEFNFELDRNPWGGIYKSDVEVTYDGESGQEVLGETTEDILTEELTFVMVPSLYVVGLYAIILILVSLSIYLIVHSIRSKKIAIQKSRKYIIKKGDTLESIASDRNMKWKLLAKINKIKAPYSVVVGDKLMVPPIIGKKKVSRKKLSDKVEKKSTTKKKGTK